MNRRDFLKTSAVVAAGAALPTVAPLAAEAKEEKAIVKKYNLLGKTGLKMSDISYGTGKLPSPSMVVRAVDRGINYFDTAPDYGKSENYIGEALNKYKSKIKRDKIIIATKFCTYMPYPGHLKLGSSKQDYIDALEGSLKRMNTDYVDIVFLHAIGEMSKSRDDELKRLFSDELHSAFESLKKAGKARFLAVSSHGPNNMEDLLMEAVKSGKYDLIMPSFNFMKFPKTPDVLKEAKSRGVGVVAMKTLAGAKDMNLEYKGEKFAPSTFKWVLKHPEVDGLVITIKSVADLDLYLTASGETFNADNQKVLDMYAKMYSKEYCRTGCGECESLCPYGLSIASIMRYNMYFKDYGMEKQAMQSYSALKQKASICNDCDGGPCSGGCPYGLPVKKLLTDAHENMVFSV